MSIEHGSQLVTEAKWMRDVEMITFSTTGIIAAFAQSYIQQLLVLRGLMGFGFGGEWATAAFEQADTANLLDPSHAGRCRRLGCSASLRP